MKTLTLMISVLAICILSGCALFDLNGDGKFDPVAYLQDADISVGWVDQETGEVYTMAVDELGVKLIGEFVQAKTGYLFELADDGGISITDANGQVFQIKPKVVEDGTASE